MYMAVISSIPRIGASGTRKPCWKARSTRNARFAASKRRMLVFRTDKGTGNNNGLSVPRGFSDLARCLTLRPVMRANPDIGQALPDGVDLASTRPGRSAAAADALDLAVERGVLAVDGVVRIAEVFLRRHVL